MKEEDLIKKLEGIERHTIEPQSHRRRLREALLKSAYYKEKPGSRFSGVASLKIIVPMIVHRPVWQKILASALVVAMIIGLSSIFLLGRDPSGQDLPWESVSAKTCAAINEVTSFHIDEVVARTVWYEGEKVLGDSDEDIWKMEGDFQAPGRIHWIAKAGQELEEEYIIGDRTYNRHSGTGAWELTQMEEVNGQQVRRIYRWDSQKGEWELIDWHDGGHIFAPTDGFFEYVQPVEIVEMLKNFKDVEQLPDEVIEDTDCLHYKEKSDFPEGSAYVPDYTIEIWIGKYDHIIRQQRITYSFEKNYDPLDEHYEGIPVPDGATITGTEIYTMRFSDFNEPVEIEAPCDGIMPDEGEPLSSEWSTMAGPTTAALNSIWGSSSSDVFAVGYDYDSQTSIILHYNGSSWSRMSSGTNNELLDIWGSSSSDVFAVGWDRDSQTGTILHYDGSEWSPMANPTTAWLNSIWGSSSSDVFAVGGGWSSDEGHYYSTILHYNGSTWSEMKGGSTQFFKDVWGSSSSDVFIVGQDFDSGGSTIMHYDGSSWTEMETPTFDCAQCIWGSSASDIFAVGISGTILHYDGSTWTEMEKMYNFLGSFQCVWGSSSSDVYFGGMDGYMLYYDGDTFRKMYTGVEADLMCIWGSSASDVFAVCVDGTILHYEG